jgi:peroxiredoxin
MTLSVGDRVPTANLFEPGESGPAKLTTDSLFKGRKVVLVGMPGAFTPTCHRNHLPGFLENRDAMLSKGVDEIVVLTTNDTHVLRAWGRAERRQGQGAFRLRWQPRFHRAAGLSFDGSGTGMGDAPAASP